MKTDAQIIDDLGGPAKVADLLGFKPEIGTQRVHNWKVRGIPAKVRLDNFDVFGPAPSDETTSHSTKPPKDGGQVAGYAPTQPQQEAA
jgi:hypothetical protein